MHEHEARPDDGRSETQNERADRNWNELLQELRVTQTGTQILTGFLLTIPFQQRFNDLDAYQQDVYLVLVVLAVLATALFVAPVSLHRVLFGRRLKPELVTAGSRFARAGLVVLALVMAGSAMLIFDVVLSRRAGWTVGLSSILLLAVSWWLVPRLLAWQARA
ncbi:DUF6328 family protein [Cellulomonas fengjieae]|uniref:Sodium:proton antiporter n=1 Tax=Cellulomonas fengjieae TaxID=2819978 RepID=A0ABS3SKV4_9CELL|nr:DUF6328 family protein [Cellulomonas fengjieae]MBO3085625.1 sodium:proton antiporter [Cellulomonas fengjieae]MBO3102734.1 sodium:proton antiporter [Cellulomonas fengjieae]QVI67657.1 sodium:proton antiporter [Cellulomonas fengjieae]